MSRNIVILLGRLGRDPELRHSPSGLAVLNFTMATSETYRDKNTNQKTEKTEWHKVCTFGKNAESLSTMLSKGSQVYVEGKVTYDTYEKDGQTLYSTKIVARSIQVLDKKEASKPASPKAMFDNQAPIFNDDFTSDEIPF